MLYIWTDFLNPHPTPHLISLTTVIVACVSAAAAGVSRAFTESNGALVRSIVSYSILVAATALLVYDTGSIDSPYLFMWTLAAVFTGIFGLWSSIPVIAVVVGYFSLLIANSSLKQEELVPTILIIAVPIIFSVIVWSHVHKLSVLKKEHTRDPASYKQQSSEMSSLISESEHVINAIGDGIVAVDSQGIIQLINPAAQTLLGWSRSDALTLQYQSVLRLSDEQGNALTDATDPVRQTLNMNQEMRAQALQLETKNGKKLYISLVSSPLGDSGSGVIVIVRDITKERSEEHEQAEFISTASHEMRTPVASIEGYLGLALNPATATIDEKARDFITKAHESAQHLGRLFQDLLDVSKAEDGRLSNIPTVLDIVDFAGQVVEGLEQKAADKGLSLLYKPSPKGGERGERNLQPVFYVNLDKDHIRELVNNLTENAIKYTPSGEVSIDITGDDEHVTISVTDSGIGIPAEDIPHLFQKFYRVDNSDTREIGGTGLGLYLCRRLAETLGGRIWVESIYQQGSTFYIELPRIDSQEARRLLATQEQQAVAVQQPRQAPPTIAIPSPQAPIQAAPPVSYPVQPPLVAMQTFESPTQQPMPQVQPVHIPTPQIPQQAPATQPIQYQQQPAQPLTPVVAPPQQVYTPQPPLHQPQMPAATPVNTPLSSIEQNPAAYMQARTNTPQAPPRDAGVYGRPN